MPSMSDNVVELTEELIATARAMAEYIIKDLREIPDQKGRIFSDGKSFTIAELIERLEHLTYEGLEFIYYFMGAQKTIGSMGKQHSWPDCPEDVGGRLYEALSKTFSAHPRELKER